MATAAAGPAPSPPDSGNKSKTSISPSSSGVPRSKPLPSSSHRHHVTTRLTVDDQGEFAYKKTPSSTLMASLQLGLQHAIGSREPKPRQDILMTDFEVVETVEFPAAGSGCTPAHKYRDFTFKTYAAEAFRFFREAFGIQPDDYLLALCDRPMRELMNPGASGSLFYLSADDVFIIKTVQKKEARFLQKLLPGYYLNLTQNKKTLLPKFFGLHRYKCGSANIRIVVMNNLLPSTLKYHEKYDLKGSSYKRRAGGQELTKISPTFKDMDFLERHGEEQGISLAAEKYDILLKTLERDCKVLESFGIMDYSLLLGVHNIDQAIRDRIEGLASGSDLPDYGWVGGSEGAVKASAPVPSMIKLGKNFSIISMEDIPLAIQSEAAQAATQPLPHFPEGYIQGRIYGDRVLVYLGIIDILQSYRLKKKLEHTMKSFITDPNTVSVHNPSFYARRFQDFFTHQVFKREKVRFRTRKNSALVQLRGRRQAGSFRPQPGPRGPPSLQRLPSREQDPKDHHPLHSVSRGSTSSQTEAPPLSHVVIQKDSASFRQRLVEEVLATGREPQLPEVPSLELYRGRGSVEGERREGERKEGEGPQESELETGRLEGADFASNVRGTSTPIEEGSPNLESARDSVFVEHSQTFDASVGVRTADVSPRETSTAAVRDLHATEDSQSPPRESQETAQS